MSLPPPLGKGEGYHLYRLNPDKSCTEINLLLKSDGSYAKVSEGLIRDTVFDDRFVEPGRTYSYATTAVKQDRESGYSNVAVVTISSP